MQYDGSRQNRSIYSELSVYILRALDDGACFKNIGNVGFRKTFTKGIRDIMLFCTAKIHNMGEKTKIKVRFMNGHTINRQHFTFYEKCRFRS